VPDLRVMMLECCCGSREPIQTGIGVLFKDGKATGGTPQLIRAAFLAKGVVVA
jgi:hypothetical protein